MMPLLIAKQKNAKLLKDYYHLGWLMQDETGYYWVVWGCSSNIDNAMKVTKQLIEEKGKMPIFISDTPIERGVIVHEPLPELREVNP